MRYQLAGFSRMAVCTALTSLAWVGAAWAQSPTVFNACITALTGVYYEPKQPGVCFHHTHRPVSWTSAAGAILSGSTAGGDLGGSYPNPAVHALRGRPIADVAPTANQVLAWNGSAWGPADPASGGLTGAAGGDLTGTYPNPSIAAEAVTSSKIADNTIDDADVVDDGLDGTSLATSAVGSDEIGDGTISSADVADGSLQGIDLVSQSIGNGHLAANAITGDKVLNGHLVRSVNGLRDAITIAAGTGVSIAPSGQTLTISATGGGGGTTGQLGATTYGTQGLTVTSAGAGFFAMPGMTQTISVPANSRVIIATDGGAQTTSTATTGFSIVDVAIFIDNNFLGNGGYRRLIVANSASLVSAFENWAMQVVVELTAGTHIIQVGTSHAGGANAVVSGTAGSTIQGALSVSVIKL